MRENGLSAPDLVSSIRHHDLRLYHRLHLDGQQQPQPPAVAGALRSCARCKLLETGRKIHAYAIDSGSDSDTYVANALVDMYSKCGSMPDARAAFDRITNPSVVSWTPLLFGYVRSGQPESTLTLFAAMRKLGCPPNRVAFLAAVKACAVLASHEEGRKVDGRIVKVQSLVKGREIHAEAESLGYDSETLLASSLLEMYAKCGSMADARTVFEMIESPDVVAWSSLILGYAENGDGGTALALFEDMQRRGTRANDRTYVSAVKACGCLKNLEKITEVHSRIEEAGLESNMYVASSLVDAYAKCGSLKLARRIFDRIRDRDTVVWNAMILGYVEGGEFKLGLNLFQRMQEEGCCLPNRVSFVAALKACCGLGAVGIGRRLEIEIHNLRLEKDLVLATSLVDFYGKCGCMSDAQRVFDSFPAVRSSVAWNALIAGYSRQGNSRQVFEVFRGMIRQRVQPDEITFMAVLAVCCHAGLVEEGREYFRLMDSRYSVAPTVEHYGYVIELLGGANKMEDAVMLVRSSEVEPRLSLWMTLLGACRKWRNVEIGRLAFEGAVSLDERKAAAYVLIATIFEEAGLREESAKVQANKYFNALM